MPPALQTPYLRLAALFRHAEETVRHRDFRRLLRGQKNREAVDGLQGHRQAGARFDFARQPLEVLPRRFRFLHVERVHQRMEHAVALPLRGLHGHQEFFPRQGVDGLVRLDFAEAGVLVTRVAEAADEQPFERRAAEVVALTKFLGGV